MATFKAQFDYGLKVLLLALLYVSAARLSLSLDPVGGFATLVWPCSGIALAAMILSESRLWPGIFVGAFAANVWMHAPLHVAAGIALGNTMEAWIAALCLRRAIHFHRTMDRLQDVAGFVLLASALSTVISATLGVSSLILGGAVLPSAFLHTWFSWWLGDAIGILIVTPVVLTWSIALPRAIELVRLLEYGALTLALGLVSVLVFYDFPGKDFGPLQQPYMLFSVVIWSGLRFGQRETATISFLVSALSVAATALGFGPFVRSQLSESLAYLQAFIAFVAMTGLFLCAVVTERQVKALQLSSLNEELQRALRARDSFLSIASHELRTPLGALQLQMQMLLRKRDVADSQDRLLRVDRQIKRLSKLLDSLLDVSQISSGRLNLEPEIIALSDLVKEVTGRFEEECQRVGCKLIVHADPKVMGQWDAMRIEQIVSNLVSNAIKYGAGKPIEVTVEDDGPVARILVQDYGMGISAADQERIFERFERLVPQRHSSGLGLGLWITRQIIETMGGKIYVISTPTVGSKFVVEIPKEETEKLEGDSESSGFIRKINSLAGADNERDKVSVLPRRQ